jgi:hypothetical protein
MVECLTVPTWPHGSLMRLQKTVKYFDAIFYIFLAGIDLPTRRAMSQHLSDYEKKRLENIEYALNNLSPCFKIFH